MLLLANRYALQSLLILAIVSPTMQLLVAALQSSSEESFQLSSLYGVTRFYFGDFLSR